MKTYDYEAVLVKQTPTSAGIVLFGAPASHIAMWGGIPQKRQLGGADFGETETTGFQRELDPRRLDNSSTFTASRQTSSRTRCCARPDKDPVDR